MLNGFIKINAKSIDNSDNSMYYEYVLKVIYKLKL